ncbi:hypothetical protein DFP72DRAFT_883543, partial [Ephemerocybe angulata]
ASGNDKVSNTDPCSFFPSSTIYSGSIVPICLNQVVLVALNRRTLAVPLNLASGFGPFALVWPPSH